MGLVIVEMFTNDQKSMLNLFTHPWRVAVVTPTTWLDIKNTNEVWEYLACLKVLDFK